MPAPGHTRQHALLACSRLPSYRRTHVTPGSGHTIGSVGLIVLHPKVPPIAGTAQSDRVLQVRPFPAHPPPTRPAPSRCLRGRPSSVLRPNQTVPLSHSKPPAAPHVFPCPHSFGPLRPLTRQTGPHVHCAADLAQDGDLHLRPVIASQGRLPVVKRQSPGSETTCCAPAERCGTAQYFGQKREAEQSQNEKITCTLTGSNI